MGYFDEAKAAREEENSLEHSSGPWKKHKYIQKIGEGASAKYKYAKDKWNKDVTGKAYKDEAKDEKQRAEYAGKRSDIGYTRLIDGRDVDNVQNGGANLTFKKGTEWARSSEYHGRKAAEAESVYYTKSLAGKSAKTVARGKSIIKGLFTPKVTVKTSSNLRDQGTSYIKKAKKEKLKKNKLSIKKPSNSSSNANVFTLGDDGTTQAPSNGKWKKAKHN